MLLRVLTFILLLTLLAPSAFAKDELGELIDSITDTKTQPSQQPQRSFDEALILTVTLGSYTISDAIISYQHQTGLLVPLSQMMDALDFPVNVHPTEGRAEGWFLDENRLFLLDVKRGEVIVEGDKQDYRKELIEQHDDDIYVDAALFSKWFPVDMQPDLPSSRLKITSREKLPLEQKLERQKGYSGLGRGRQHEEINLPPLDMPYTLMSIPRMETSLQGDYTNVDGSTRTTWNSFFAGDLLYMTGNLFVSGDEHQGLSNLRLMLERKDPEAELTPLGLSEIMLGDVFMPAIPLMTRSQAGRGVAISNFPLESIREFDRVTLRGDLPIGWEVELYRNDSLLDVKTRPDSNGQYEFSDIQLLFGRNVMRLAFYGPQGQKREEIKTYNVGADSTPPGQHFFSLAVNQHETDIFESINERALRGANDVDEGETRAAFEYRAGLTTSLSATAALASISVEGERQDMAKVGLLTSLLGTLTELNFVNNFDNGYAVEIGTQFELLGISTNLSYEDYSSGFISEESANINGGINDAPDSISRALFNGTLDLEFLPRISWGVDGEHIKRISGQSDILYGNRISSTIGEINFSNTLDGRKIKNSSSSGEDRLTGSLLLNSSQLFNNLSLRGDLGYDIRPKKDLNNMSLTGDYDLDERTGLRFGISKQLTIDKLVTYNAGFNRDFDRFALSANSSYRDDGELTAGVSISFSADFDPRARKVRMSRDMNAERGAVLSRIFLDNNVNSKFDEGDEPIENARINVGPRAAQNVSGEDGVVYVDNLNPYRKTNISLNGASLDDPFWRPLEQGRQIIPRPGKTARIDFPVSMTGEIDGTVSILVAEDEATKAKEDKEEGKQDNEIEQKPKSKPVSSVTMELVNSSGKVVQSVKTFYDGFYLFLNVLPDSYTVRIAPKQIKEYGLNTAEPQQAIIEKDGTILNGVDFILSVKEEEQ